MFIVGCAPNLDGLRTAVPCADGTEMANSANPHPSVDPVKARYLRAKKAAEITEKTLKASAEEDPGRVEACITTHREAMVGTMRAWKNLTKIEDVSSCDGREDLTEKTQCQEQILTSNGHYADLAVAHEHAGAVSRVVEACDANLKSISERMLSGQLDVPLIKPLPDILERGKVDVIVLNPPKMAPEIKGLTQLQNSVHFGIEETRMHLADFIGHEPARYLVDATCDRKNPQITGLKKEAFKIHADFVAAHKAEIAHCNRFPPPNFEDTEGACKGWVMGRHPADHIAYLRSYVTYLRAKSDCSNKVDRAATDVMP